MNTVTKSELIEALAEDQVHLAHRDVEYSVNTLLEKMSEALITGRRIEIRGFGSISLRYRAPRVGRNPKTGAAVTVPEKYVPHFKPGRSLRERVNRTVQESGDRESEELAHARAQPPSVLDKESGGL